ncbi:ABC transporter ATP-binding protein [Clostridium paridis]|uniref:ABC transporter ATP-binding protein n=1 Tax=Clostridium paridis TaxID=2803863 RepID=A0A937FJP1_9CLOT|nr:ABC transporter ATP-binding protein [Clostridium paridis]MBL4933588.1 ABC transporter ATP-binding protein [Clostridium paridis]
MKVIELYNVNKIYGKDIKTQALYDITLNVEKGEFVSIIGQSGSGKSTLLNIVGTLDKASTGSVSINGKDISSLNKKDLADLRNKEIGFVFQFHYLLPEFTVLENVLMPYEISGMKVSKAVKDHAIELLNLVGLKNYMNKYAGNLSGGQQQRTAIARALINNPSIVLADEPTGNLDTKSTREVYELFRDINTNMKTTFMIITHDNRIAEKTDRVIEISDGRIIN